MTGRQSGGFCRRAGCAAAALFASGIISAQAGGGPLNTLVIVNDQSTNSLTLGRYYADIRGIPDRNIFHISVATNYNVDALTFSNAIRAPVFAYLAAAGLSNQINYLLFSCDIPYRVFTPPFSSRLYASLTASMFYGFQTTPDSLQTSICYNPDSTTNDYAYAERAFEHAAAPSSNRYYISALLAAYNMDQVRRLVDRAAGGDGQHPAAQIAMLQSEDLDRNVQWPFYEETDFSMRFLSESVSRLVTYANVVTGKTNLMGYMTGAASVPWIASNKFARGAFAEHLTSFGGFLLDPNGQTSILDWIAAGAAGSYGTVVEPCGYTQKFTNPRFYFWYTRGFSLGESQFMAVENPYQGVLVGDPLSAPYVSRPSISISGIGGTVTGTVAVTMVATGHSAFAPIGRVDLFLDDLWLTTLTNVAPTEGNEISVTIGAVTNTYTVPNGGTIFAAARGLADAINATVTNVSARASGDRIALIADPAADEAQNLDYSVAADAGLAPQLSIGAFAATTNLLPTTYFAREIFDLTGMAATNETLSLTVTLTNGLIASNVVNVSSGTFAFAAIKALMNTVNSNLTLQGLDGVQARNYAAGYWGFEMELAARNPGREGMGIHVDYSISGPGLQTNQNFSDYMNDNSGTMGARGMIFISAGHSSVTCSYSLATTALPDGPHKLTAVAYDGTAVRAQGRAEVQFITSNQLLRCSIADFPPGRMFAHGSVITAQVFTADGLGSVTQVTLYAEGKVYAVTSAPPYTFTIATTNFGAGWLSLRALARSSADESAVSQAAHALIFTDADGDGMSDEWEYVRLGSATNSNGTLDSDHDGVKDVDEFLADTDPADASSKFQIVGAALHGLAAQIEFSARSTRQYRVEFLNGDLSDAGAWTADPTNFAAGAEGLMLWTNLPPSTNAVRFYRINAQRP